MALSFSRTFDPFFPFTSSHRELRNLCRFADSMEQAFARSEAIEHYTPNYRFHRGSDDLRLEVELPGVAKEHIEIELHGVNLSVTARRFKTQNATTPTEKDGDEQGNNEDANTVNNNSVSHVYKLRFNVGNKVDEGNIKAEHKNGVLNLVVPFKGESGVRKIEIS